MALKVQHLVRWSPQDWRTCRVRGRSATTGDPMLRIVYLECLFALYESGGSLSPDPEVLADVLMLPSADIARCLPALLQIGQSGRGGLYIEDGQLRNRRATEDIEEELEYRQSAKEHGRKGGRPPLSEEREPQGTPKGTLSDPKGTPRAPARPHAPPPPPLPTPTPTPENTPTHPAGATPGPAREEQAPRQKTGAPPPDPRVARASKANGGKIPGEEQLEDLAAALWSAHPTGVRGGSQVATQRALLELLVAGRIWPDESPPEPSPPEGFGMSFSALRARHEAWLAVWRPRGTVPPMNLPRRWLARDGNGGGLDFLDLPPPQEGKAPAKANGAQAATRRRWGSDLAPGTTQADVDRARAFDDKIFGPREG